MPDQKLDVIGVGNAIVDVLAKAGDAFLTTHDIPKGGMILIDEPRAHRIYAEMAAAVEISGGSAANSIACIASLGGQGGFIGKVSDDELGEIFRHDLRAMGVEFNTAPLKDGAATGRCLINVTPDAQRSMATFLGAAGYVTPDDVDPEQVKRAEITFFEGYLFEQPMARDGFTRACAIAKENGKRTALWLGPDEWLVIDETGDPAADCASSKAAPSASKASTASVPSRSITRAFSWPLK